MTQYKVEGIKSRTDYSFALREIHIQTDDDENFRNRNMRKHQVKLRYDSKKGILTFVTDTKIDSLELRAHLIKEGLTLRVLG